MPVEWAQHHSAECHQSSDSDFPLDDALNYSTEITNSFDVVSAVRDATTASTPLQTYLELADSTGTHKKHRGRREGQTSTSRDRDRGLRRSNSILSTVLVEGELQTRRLKTVLRSTGGFLELETRRAEQAESRAEHAEMRAREATARVAEVIAQLHRAQLELARNEVEIRRYKMDVDRLERELRRERERRYL